MIKKNRVVIVGGSSGIGFTTAQMLLNKGVKSIVIASRNKSKLETAKAKLNYKDEQNVYTISFDITDISSHMNFIEEATKMLKGNPDVLIISSGVTADSGNWKGFNVSEELYDRIMDTNLKGPFFLLRNFSNYIFEKEAKANICMVSSISAHRDMLGAYQFAKNTLSGIITTYGKYLFKRGIILNGVEPGTTDTEMMPHLKPYTDGIREGKPWGDNAIGRVIRPEEIAEIICYLIGKNSEVLSGTCILASGGCKSISRGY